MRLPVTPGPHEPGSLGQAGVRLAMKPIMQTEKTDQCLACRTSAPTVPDRHHGCSAQCITAVQGLGHLRRECRNGAITMVEVAEWRRRTISQATRPPRRQPGWRR